MTPGPPSPGDVHLVLTEGGRHALTQMLEQTFVEATRLRTYENDHAKSESNLNSALASLTSMIRLGGRIIGTEFNERPGVEGYADRLGIQYGVVLHRDGSWSVNS